MPGRATIRLMLGENCQPRMLRTSDSVAVFGGQLKTCCSSNPWCSPYPANPEISSRNDCPRSNDRARPTAYWNIWLPRPPRIWLRIITDATYHATRKHSATHETLGRPKACLLYTSDAA